MTSCKFFFFFIDYIPPYLFESLIVLCPSFVDIILLRCSQVFELSWQDQTKGRNKWTNI